MSKPVPELEPNRMFALAPADRLSFGEAYERLVAVMARLRAPGGCPWDRAQDLESLRPYLIEEAYEVLDALDGGSVEGHREELGDLLLQVVFQAEIRRERGEFDAADVAHGIADKLVRRHPHVFGSEAAEDVGQAFEHWETVKAKEKEKQGKAASALSGVPRELPALLRAQRVSEKASRTGFDWKDVSGPLAKVDEELKELREAISEGHDKDAICHELGDVLFSLANVARFLEVDAENALRDTTSRFSSRFEFVERSLRDRGLTVRRASDAQLDEAWTEAKKQGRGKAK